MTERELYLVEREFAVSPDRMWQAWTEASQLEAWYHPAVLSIVPGSVTSDAVVGGRWALAVDVPMNDMVAYFWGRYTDVVDGSRIEHTMSYSQDEAEFVARDDDAPAHRVVVDFTPTDLGIRVRFTQFGDMPEEQIDATRQGMGSYFDSLDSYLADFSLSPSR